MSAALALTLYRRQGCHLCDAAEALLADEARRAGRALALTRIDIQSDPALLARFFLEIPVIADAAGRVLLSAPIERAAVRALLAAPGPALP